MRRVAVIGAGVVGLSTAVNVQARIPDVSVTIISDAFDVDTTSDGAAGIFRPLLSKTPGVPLPTLRRWLQTSWDHYEQLRLSDDGTDAGISLLGAYQFYHSKQTELPLYSEFVYGLRECTETECRRITTKAFPFAYQYTTMLCECRRYLPYLMQKFVRKGGRVVKRTITDLEELVGEFDVVVNCAGLGSLRFLKDDKVVPIKGQLLKVTAPWIKMAIYNMDTDTYIVPGRDWVNIGGTHDVGAFDPTVSEEDGRAIWERATQLVPALKGARWQRQWVGLRPHREPLRLEAETVRFPSGASLRVVHNYGHGGEGVSLSWGTAVDAAGLVQALLTPTKSKM